MAARDHLHPVQFSSFGAQSPNLGEPMPQQPMQLPQQMGEPAPSTLTYPQSGGEPAPVPQADGEPVVSVPPIQKTTEAEQANENAKQA